MAGAKRGGARGRGEGGKGKNAMIFSKLFCFMARKKKYCIAVKMINEKLYRKQEKYHDLKGRRKLFWIILNITIPHTSYFLHANLLLLGVFLLSDHIQSGHRERSTGCF